MLWFLRLIHGSLSLSYKEKEKEKEKELLIGEETGEEKRKEEGAGASKWMTSPVKIWNGENSLDVPYLFVDIIIK